jgi:hypothetical protein
LNISGMKLRKQDVSRKIRIPTALDERLAEDIGIQVGDGSVLTYKYGDDSDYVIGVCGHRIEDRPYLENFVRPLKKSLFNLDLKLHQSIISGSCFLKLNSKTIVSFYHDVIGLPIGKKHDISVPLLIRKAPEEITSAFLRGLGDTDFSLSFIKKTKVHHKYPVLHLGCQSKPLISQVDLLLNKLGINAATCFDCEEFDSRTGKTYIKQNLYISGKHELKVWMKKIGFHNPVQYTRYLIWDKFGFCPPKTNLSQRMQILDGIVDPEKFDS